MILIIYILLSCATQPTGTRSWFPDDIMHDDSIIEYINNFNSNDLNAARDAYIKLLEFIEELIEAHHENLARAYRLDTPSVKIPALINGRLTIVECTHSVSYHIKWDDVLEEIIELGPKAHVLGELTQIIHNCYLYNKLINHWFFLTGESLGEHIDVENVWEKLLHDHVPLYSSYEDWD